MYTSQICPVTRGDPVLNSRWAISDDSESVQITKCSLDDLLMSLKANKMALNSAVYMEDVDGKCSLRGECGQMT